MLSDRINAYCKYISPYTQMPKQDNFPCRILQNPRHLCKDGLNLILNYLTKPFDKTKRQRKMALQHRRKAYKAGICSTQTTLIILYFTCISQIERQLDVDALFILRRRFTMVCNRVRSGLSPCPTKIYFHAVFLKCTRFSFKDPKARIRLVTLFLVSYCISEPDYKPKTLYTPVYSIRAAASPL